MQVLGKVANDITPYYFTIHSKCQNIIMYRLSETQIIEHPDDKHCIYWLNCPICHEQFEVTPMGNYN